MKLLSFDLGQIYASSSALLASGGGEYAAAASRTNVQDEEDLDLGDLDDELLGKPSKGKGKAKATPQEDDLSHLSARERVMHKRKRKAEAKAESSRPAKYVRVRPRGLTKAEESLRTVQARQVVKRRVRRWLSTLGRRQPRGQQQAAVR